MKGKILSVALAASLAMSTSAFASGLTDINGHWAENAINKMVSSGAVHGYPDGTFKPDKEITRAEFVSMLNSAFGISTVGAQANFSDVKASDWFYTQVAAGQAAGYIHGYSDHSFKPNNPITREEAAAIVANLLKLDTSDASATSFSDSNDLDSWAAGSVAAIAKSNVMHGYPDGGFKPHNLITRAEAVVTLENALGVKGATTVNTPTTVGTPTVASVSAVNGTITVTFDRALAETPTVSDFVVSQAIDGGTATTVTPTSVSVDSTNEIVTLTVPTVSGSSVVDTVSYKGGTAVTALSFSTMISGGGGGGSSSGSSSSSGNTTYSLTTGDNTISASGAVTITVPTDVAGTYTVNAPSATAITLTGGNANSIVNINAPLAAVTSSATLGTVNLVDPLSFDNEGTVTTLLDTQPTNLTITNGGTVSKTVISTPAPVTLGGSGSYEELNVANANANITLGTTGSTVTIGNLTVDTSVVTNPSTVKVTSANPNNSVQQVSAPGLTITTPLSINSVSANVFGTNNVVKATPSGNNAFSVNLSSNLLTDKFQSVSVVGSSSVKDIKLTSVKNANGVDLLKVLTTAVSPIAVTNGTATLTLASLGIVDNGNDGVSLSTLSQLGNLTISGTLEGETGTSPVPFSITLALPSSLSINSVSANMFGTNNVIKATPQYANNYSVDLSSNLPTDRFQSVSIVGTSDINDIKLTSVMNVNDVNLLGLLKNPVSSIPVSNGTATLTLASLGIVDNGNDGVSLSTLSQLGNLTISGTLDGGTGTSPAPFTIKLVLPSTTTSTN